MKPGLSHLLFFTFLFFITGFISAQSQPVVTDNAKTELVSENLTVVPGQPFWIGVHMELRENWYVYYRNPGDSGMPLMLEWMQEQPVGIGEIQFPYPKWINVSGGLTSHGYYGEVLFLMEAVAPDDLEPGDTFTLEAEADWLICEDLCIPEYADLKLELAVAEGEPEYSSHWRSEFDQTRAKLPVELDYWTKEAEYSDGNVTLHLSTDAFDIPVPDELLYFAKEEGQIAIGADQPVEKEGNRISIELRKSEYMSGDPDHLWGLLYNSNGWDEEGSIKAMLIDLTLEDPVDELASEAESSPLSAGFLMILIFAFTGGLILNLMPCVFPILSIKVMNFMQMSGHSPDKARNHGWVFAAGVLLSFLLLAGLLLLLRAGGQELGWGFQLQTPAFIAFLAFLMFALGLSLMGLFEIGSSLVNVAGKADTGDGLKGSFFSGILATILATPCTAPFMGTALGVAVTLPAGTALLIFGVLGAGMAAPYVILSSSPALMKRLPKPGPWMETFKQAMAFPLFATVIWLVWVFGRQTGVDGLVTLLIGLFLLSIAIWILYRWNAFTISGTSRVISRLTATLFVLAGLYISMTIDTQTDSSATGGTDSYGITWEAYSDETLQEHLANGENVFIDFTADWCITCKANERVVFSSGRVVDRFDELGFVMVKADWTNRNPEITRALESFGRNGVPLYVIYSEKLDEPMVLPEILTPNIVMNALETLSDLVASR